MRTGIPEQAGPTVRGPSGEIRSVPPRLSPTAPRPFPLLSTEVPNCTRQLDVMSSVSSSTSADQGSSPSGTLQRVARTAARIAGRLTTGVARLSGMSAGAGLVLWGVLWWPGDTTALGLFFEGLTLFLFVLPAGILALLYQGLSDIRALPDRLAKQSVRAANHSAKTVRTVTGDASPGGWNRLWRIIRQVWSLRSLLLEHRALLVRYGALVRFVNPGFLLLVTAAIGVSLLLIPLAILVVAWVAIW